MATHFALGILAMTSFATVTPRFQLLLLMPPVWVLSGPTLMWMTLMPFFSASVVTDASAEVSRALTMIAL